MKVVLASVLTVMSCGQAPLARHETANFVVHAESPQVARRVAETAEAHRKRLAKLWHGKKLENWSVPCRIRVTITTDRPQAFTDVSYEQGRVVAHQMELKGDLDALLKGPLPHELTHVLMGHYFGKQLPRWADEGAAILSEHENQATQMQKVCRRIVAAGDQFPLRRLLAMQDYPGNLRCLYAQGHSVCRFLVAAKGHQTFLAFLDDGTRHGWDDAVREHYGYKSIEQLEHAWLSSLTTTSQTRAQDARELAAVSSAAD
jgi:hypothetical protein